MGTYLYARETLRIRKGKKIERRKRRIKVISQSIAAQFITYNVRLARVKLRPLAENNNDFTKKCFTSATTIGAAVMAVRHWAQIRNTVRSARTAAADDCEHRGHRPTDILYYIIQNESKLRQTKGRYF